MTAPRRIGILGGTFDPIHLGHLGAAEVARDCLALDQVWLMPANIPPHRPNAPDASGSDRLAMTVLAVGGRPRLVASDLELERDGRSYTAATLRRLHEAGWDPVELFFITGADAFAEIATWRDYPDILDLSHFVVIARLGYPFGQLRDRVPALASRMRMVEAEPPAAGGPDSAAPRIWLVEALTPDVSSTHVRERLREDRPLTGLVPAAVERYILAHHLYGTGRDEIARHPGETRA